MIPSEFSAALLGGGLSTFTAFIVLRQQIKWSEKQQANEALEQKNTAALSAQIKLLNIHATFNAIQTHIDSCQPNHSNQDPADYFFETIAPSLMPSQFTTKELSLCLESNDKGLVDKMLSLQANARSAESALQRMNENLQDYQATKDSSALATSEIQGNTGILDINIEAKPILDAKAARLNALIGHICQNTPEDIKSSTETYRRFASAVNSLKGIAISNEL